MKFTSKSPAETLKIAQKFAKELKGGEILALVGNLGAGKTVFTKGLAKGLGVKRTVNSPTFVLMKVYQGKRKKVEGRGLKLIHIDCYRVNNPQEILDIGAGEYFGEKNTVVVIEWADKIKKILPQGARFIEFGIKSKSRVIKLSWFFALFRVKFRVV